MATYGDRMTYWQRVANLLDFSAIFVIEHIGAYFQRLFPAHVTDIIAMGKASAYLFVNTDEFLDFPRPINHRIVYVGGIGVEAPKQLESVRFFLKLQNVGVVFYRNLNRLSARMTLTVWYYYRLVLIWIQALCQIR